MDERNCEHETWANTHECVVAECPDRVFEEAPGFWVCDSMPATTTTTTVVESVPVVADVEPTPDLLATLAILVAVLFGRLWPW